MTRHNKKNPGVRRRATPVATSAPAATHPHPPQTVADNTSDRCMVVTQDGRQCTRRALFSLDLTKGVEIKGVNIISPVYCCKFCTQHALIMGAYYGAAAMTDKRFQKIFKAILKQ